MDRGVKGVGIIGDYHARRVVPLMAHALPLYRMMPGMSFEGTVLVDEALPYSEVAQHVKEATEPTKDSAGGVLDIVYPVPGHPHYHDFGASSMRRPEYFSNVALRSSLT